MRRAISGSEVGSPAVLEGVQRLVGVEERGAGGEVDS